MNSRRGFLGSLAGFLGLPKILSRGGDDLAKAIAPTPPLEDMASRAGWFPIESAAPGWQREIIEVHATLPHQGPAVIASYHRISRITGRDKP